jgi:hypothetical protein
MGKTDKGTGPKFDSLTASAKFTSSVLGKPIRVEVKPAKQRQRPHSSAKKPVNKTPLQSSSKPSKMSMSTQKFIQSIKTAT